MKKISKSAQAKAMLAEGKTISEIVKAVGCNPALVYVVRKAHFPEMVRKYKARKKYTRKEIVKALDFKTVTSLDDIRDRLPAPMRKLVAEGARKQLAEINAVNHPAHYTAGGIEVYDFIKAKKLSYELGNVVKYVSRAEYKGNKLQDLQKARWYLDAAIKQETAKGDFAVGVE